MLGTMHELAVLHAAELRERTIRRLITPDALAWREHRIAAIAFFVVAIVLIAMHDDFVADFPAGDLAAHRPHDTGRLAARDVKRIFVRIDRRDRLAEACPYAVVVHARSHHENEHIMAVELPCGHDFDL